MASVLTTIRRAIALCAASVCLFASTTTAGASGSGFRSQALDAGLSPAQATQLQNRVDDYLARTGGTQVGVNKIALDGADLVLPLPGEKKARDLSVHGTDAVQAACPYYHFCAYKDQNGNGEAINMYYCSEYYIDWISIGSWTNNQTPGTRARFLNISRETIDISDGAPSYRWWYDWRPVYFVRPCGI